VPPAFAHSGSDSTSTNFSIVNGARKTYLDGQLVASDVSFSAFISPDTYRTLGVGQFGDAVWLGKIDDVRVYNRALSATEIKQLYNLGAANVGHSNAMISNGLVGYWTFDGKDTNWTTGQTRDLSVNGNNGSLAFMSTSSSPTIGKIGQALNFVGSCSNYITMGNVLHPTGAFSNQNPVDGNPTIMSKFTDAEPETWFGFAGPNGNPLELDISSGNTPISAADIRDRFRHTLGTMLWQFTMEE
jgi:Concanavalin A-like lectin/glucanases superfamily